MFWNLLLESLLLGVGLAMDAFSVSAANGLNEPNMGPKRMCVIAGTFGLFQAVMPLIGWFCVHTIAEAFESFQKFIPWIALILLLYIGGKMLIEGLRGNTGEAKPAMSNRELIIDGIATSIDALSVGFAIAHYTAPMALFSALIIGVVTFFISLAGLKIGKVLGDKISDKAQILGGCILIFIGFKVFFG